MRRRLVLGAIAITSLVVVAFLGPLAVLVADLARDRALTAAEREAQFAAQVLPVVLRESGAEGVADLVASLNASRRLWVVMRDGTVVGPALPDPDIGAAVEQARREGRSLRAQVDGGEIVVIPAFQAAGEDPAVVVAFVPDGELRRNVGPAWVVLGTLGVALVALSVVVADRLARSVVGAVGELADATRTLGSGDLSARVTPSGPPEIADVGRAFNTLAERIGQLVQEEREAVADLSHRLRTPLTALQLGVERLHDGPEKEALLDEVDRLHREVDAVIREARRPVREGAGTSADLAAVARDRAEFWGPLATEQGRGVTVDIPSVPIPVPVDRSDLEQAVDSLIGNVFAHTYEGVDLRIQVALDGREAMLVVEDAGPGFVDPSVVERGISLGASTGLGLDIARRTARAAGGDLALGTSPELGGARVELRFRRAV